MHNLNVIYGLVSWSCLKFNLRGKLKYFIYRLLTYLTDIIAALDLVITTKKCEYHMGFCILNLCNSVIIKYI